MRWRSPSTSSRRCWHESDRLDLVASSQLLGTNGARLVVGDNGLAALILSWRPLQTCVVGDRGLQRRRGIGRSGGSMRRHGRRRPVERMVAEFTPATAHRHPGQQPGDEPGADRVRHRGVATRHRRERNRCSCAASTWGLCWPGAGARSSTSRRCAGSGRAMDPAYAPSKGAVNQLTAHWPSSGARGSTSTPSRRCSPAQPWQHPPWTAP